MACSLRSITTRSRSTPTRSQQPLGLGVAEFRVARRQFHASRSSLIAVGDALPNIDLMEGSPGNRLSLAKALAFEKGLVIGVPAAFSKLCHYSSTRTSEVASRLILSFRSSAKARRAQRTTFQAL